MFDEAHGGKRAADCFSECSADSKEAEKFEGTLHALEDAGFVRDVGIETASGVESVVYPTQCTGHAGTQQEKDGEDEGDLPGHDDSLIARGQTQIGRKRSI